MKRSLLFLLIGVNSNAFAQSLGGERTMQFLQLSNSAHVTAMGGLVVSNPSDDIQLAAYNPALLRPSMHNQLYVGHNFFFAGTQISTAHYASLHKKSNTMFAGGLTFLQHGNLTRTDANGTVLGNFNANEFVAQVQASRYYKKNWRYGAGIKFANSKIAEFGSMAILADAGLYYYDSTKLFSFAATAKNFGAQIKKYNKDNPSEPMPFDLQMGVSKKFAKAPFRLNMMAHSLYAWDIRYSNPADAQNTLLFGTDSNAKVENFTVDKIFRHVNFSTDILLGKNLELIVGYSHRRRKELVIANKPGIVGFSFGLHLKLKKLDITYGRSNFHIAGPYNEISINMNMKDLFHL